MLYFAGSSARGPVRSAWLQPAIMDVWEDPAIWDELVDFGKEHPTVGPSRRLLGGSFDLTAEENQVYLFMVRRRTLHEPNLP